MNYISHKPNSARKPARIGQTADMGDVERDMINRTIQKAKKAVQERCESPLSILRDTATSFADNSTNYTDCYSQYSDNEEFKAEPMPKMPVVLEKGESVCPEEPAQRPKLKHCTEEEFENQISQLTALCDAQRAEVERVEAVSNKAQSTIDSCKALIRKIDNYTTETPRELQREFNVIAYGPNHTVDAKGNVTMYLKDAHSRGGIVALAHQRDLRVAKMIADAEAKKASFAGGARAARDARAASRDRSLH